jgi:hypothetical protein
MARLTIYISVVFCLIIVVGCVAGTKQQAGAYNEPYGKYYSLRYPQDYLELKPDGSFLFRIRERDPSGGDRGRNLEASGTYKIKGDIVSVKPIIPSGLQEAELTLKGNTLVDKKGEKWIKR